MLGIGEPEAMIENSDIHKNPLGRGKKRGEQGANGLARLFCLPSLFCVRSAAKRRQARKWR
jgi:hypothetical protein